MTTTIEASQYESACRQLGIPSLRKHQREAIDAVVGRDHDLLLISPTGSGKSPAFWASGLLLGGVTVVVSPLKSLMQDQQRRLEELGIPVRVWNGDVKDKVKSEIVREIDRGWSGFMYSTPESLKGARLKSALRGRVTLAVIDEAHCCLNDRGFRYSYAWLGRLLDQIQPRRRMACTATIIPRDRDELTRTLHMKQPEHIVVPVARSNLTIQKIERTEHSLYEVIRRHDGECGIIFTATVRAANAIYGKMRDQGWSVAIYNGGMGAKERKANQEMFMQGERHIAIATDAFILGIDKANIRFIVHYDFSSSPEAWLQGAGRAGRDGLPSFIYPAFVLSDEGMRCRRFLIKTSNAPVDDLRTVWDYLRQSPWTRLTAKKIGENALGDTGRYSGPSIVTTLKRFHLADTKVDPDDGRRRLYYATGEFDNVDWKQYERERREAFKRFDELVRISKLSDESIPSALDAYFSDESGVGDDIPF